MYVMRRGLGGRPGRILGAAFALFAVGVSLGMGSAAQASAMTQAAGAAFGIPTWICALAAAALVLPAVLGGRRSVAAVSTLVVPAMLGVYLAASAAVILGNLAHLPESLGLILRCAFSPRAAAGGAAGCAVTALDALRYGVSRGVFSNEAGLGSAGICAASAASDSPVRQAYIGMTGVFFDTTVVCTATALAICCSGVLGQADGAAQAARPVMHTASFLLVQPMHPAAGHDGKRPRGTPRPRQRRARRLWRFSAFSSPCAGPKRRQ